MSNVKGRVFASRLALAAATGVIVQPLPAAAADTTIDIVAGQTVAAGGNATPVVPVSPAAGDTITVNNAGVIRSTSAAALNRLALGGNGAGAVMVNNTGQINGRLGFGAATGPVTINNAAGLADTTQGWRFTGVGTFGAGSDNLLNGSNGLIATGSGGAATSLDFGGGADRFENAGVLWAGVNNTPNPLTPLASDLVITGLETFENSGYVVFGSAYESSGKVRAIISSDLKGDDRIQAQGAAYVGADGFLVMDSPLGLGAQAGCSVAVLADCIDLTGGSTAGTTFITVSDADFQAVPGISEAGLTLVDVSGGTSHAGDFVLDPASANYVANELFGGAIMKGSFAYTLVYDGATQRHDLVGLPSRELFAFAQLPSASQDIWRLTAGSWFARAADVRGSSGDASGRVWVQLDGERVDREAAASFTALGQTADLNLSYRQNTAALTFGLDMVRLAQGDRGFLFGAMLGLTDSELTYEASPTSAQFSGETAGVYASYLAGPAFIDALVSGSHSNLKDDVPAFTLEAMDEVTGEAYSLGARVDAGWTLPLTETLSLEPLVSIAYVQTTFEGVSLPDAEVEYDTLTSLRAGAGARLSGAADLGGLPLSYALTGRYWNEFDGETAAIVTNAGTPLSLADELEGSFGEVSGSLSMAAAGGSVVGFLEAGSRFMSDYHSYSLSAGVRYRW